MSLIGSVLRLWHPPSIGAFVFEWTSEYVTVIEGCYGPDHYVVKHADGRVSQVDRTQFDGPAVPSTPEAALQRRIIGDPPLHSGWVPVHAEGYDPILMGA